MKVGILGSGDVAQALGHGFLATGHSVRLGSRNPDAEGLVAWRSAAGPAASTGSFASATEFGELVVVATRGVELASTVQLAGEPHFAAKVVIDVTNPLVFSPAGVPSLSVGHDDSAGEQLQRLLPRAHVVKAFNIVGNQHMFRPKFPGGPPDLFFCGNDAAAKKTVQGILESFGWNTIDIGGIEGSRLLEPLCLLWVNSARQLGSWDIAFKLLRK